MPAGFSQREGVSVSGRGGEPLSECCVGVSVPTSASPPGAPMKQILPPLLYQSLYLMGPHCGETCPFNPHLS